MPTAVTIINNLTSNSTTAALSANQSFIRDGRVTAAQTTANSSQAAAGIADGKAVAAQNTANTAVVNVAMAQAKANTALQQDGSVTSAADQNLGSHKLTNVAAPTAAPTPPTRPTSIPRSARSHLTSP